ncbi:MAG: AEC family transporter, partial [Gemmiger sp.]
RRPDMAYILLKSAAFLFIMALGYALKHFGFFGPEDYKIPMKLVLNVTLPAAVITSFAAYQPDLSLLLCAVIGFGLNWLMLAIAWMCSRNHPLSSRAVWLNSVPGFNIGAFALPFVQSFLSPAGVVSCCLFDAGSALMCTGGTYAITSAALDKDSPFSLESVGRNLLSSRPFLTYLLMLLVSLAKLPVPQALVDFISPIASANAFLAMLMVGMMFDLKLNKVVLRDVAGMAAVRIVVAVAATCGCFFLLPFSLEIRQALVIAVFAPVSVASTAFSVRAGGAPAEAAAVNSLCIPISVAVIIGMLTAFGAL